MYTRGSGTRSSTTSRRSSPISGGSERSGCGGRSGLAGIGPKYRSAHARTCTRSQSPTTERTALLGAYQVRKNALTSSTEAASRSAIEPIVGWWYGWLSGNRWPSSFSFHVPYGRLS